jgi:hypothetical protein
MTTLQQILETIADNGGAVLYWQLHEDDVKEAVEHGGCRIVDELLVHPDAIEVERGVAYEMPIKKIECDPATVERLNRTDR